MNATSVGIYLMVTKLITRSFRFLFSHNKHSRHQTAESGSLGEQAGFSIRESLRSGAAFRPPLCFLWQPFPALRLALIEQDNLKGRTYLKQTLVSPGSAALPGMSSRAVNRAAFAECPRTVLE